MSELRGKVVIVTGAGQGIGLGIASYLARQGASVVMADFNAKSVESAQTACLEERLSVLALQADVRKREDAFAVVERAVSTFGRIDALINNAQITPTGAFEDITEDQLRQATESGVHGTVWFMQAVFPYMKAAGRGSIVNVASSAALQGHLNTGAYAASKGGVMALTRVAAREWGKYGIRVNCYLPTGVTPAFKAFFDQHPELLKQEMQKIPLARAGDPVNDVAPAVGFFVSDASAFVTGQVIGIDGGQHIGPA